MTQPADDKVPDFKLPWDPVASMEELGKAMYDASRPYDIRLANLIQAGNEGKLTPQQLQAALLEETEDRMKAVNEAVQRTLDKFA